MTCDDIDLILAVGAVSGGVARDELAQVREHTTTCARCSRAAAEYTAAADLLAVAVEPVEPPASLRNRILGEVYGSAAGGSAPRRRRGGALLRLWRSIPQGRAFTRGGLAAAAAAVALLVWTVGPGRSGSPTPPAAVSTAVRGTVVEPAVQGSLTYYPQTQTSVLSVRGLRRTSGAQVYEVWLVRPDNGVTPAGYLTEQPDGTWSAAMHGAMKGYSGVAATVEPTGGSPTPTGQQVLVGSVPSP